MIRVLDCFAGMGGFSLAGEIVNHRIGKEIFKTVGFVEWEKYCQEEILKPNFKGVPIYGDIREVSARTFPDGIDLITGGFPCQDLSIAGKKKGISGERSGLYFEIVRLFDEFSALQLRPPILLMENVANLLNGNGGDWARIVFGELAARGLNAEWKVLSAESVGAPHLRERVFIVAWSTNSDSNGDKCSRREQISSRSEWEEIYDDSRICREVSDSNGVGFQEKRTEFKTSRTPEHDSKVSNSDKSRRQRGKKTGNIQEIREKSQNKQFVGFNKSRSTRTTKSELGSLVDGIPARLASGQVWDQEPRGVPRVAHGVKGRVAALKAIGNSVVPEVVTIPLMRVAEILREL